MPMYQPTQMKAAFIPLRRGLLQRQCACGSTPGPTGTCPACRKKHADAVQRAAVSPSPINRAPSIVHNVLNSPGQPLDAATRAFMEPRFGHDFSQVRVHADPQAAAAARAINARAYTVGHQIVFADGQHAPGTAVGRGLLAHELTHTVQQMDAPTSSRRIQRAPANAPTASAPQTEDDGRDVAEENSPTPTIDTAEPAGMEAQANDAAKIGAESCGSGPAIYQGKQVFEGTIPPLPDLVPGEFNPAQQLVDNANTELAMHLHILNDARVFAEATQLATQIKGVEPGRRDGVIVEDDGRRKHAYFDGRTQPALNTAASTIILPPKPYSQWIYRAAPANKVLDIINQRPPEIVDTRKGTVEECHNRTDPVDFLLTFMGDDARLESILTKHENIHAADWQKIFCQVIGKRDARVASRTGRENARTGFALHDPARAEQRAINKLFRGIQSKDKAAQQVVNRGRWRADRLHARRWLNIEFASIVIGSGCSNVLASVQVTGDR